MVTLGGCQASSNKKLPHCGGGFLAITLWLYGLSYCHAGYSTVITHGGAFTWKLVLYIASHHKGISITVATTTE